MNEFKVKLDTIGERAAWAIECRRIQNHMKMYEVCNELNVTHRTVSNWRLSKTEPRGYHIQQMALNGYDVMWILTGVKDYGRS